MTSEERITKVKTKGGKPLTTTSKFRQSNRVMFSETESATTLSRSKTRTRRFVTAVSSAASSIRGSLQKSLKRKRKEGLGVTVMDKETFQKLNKSSMSLRSNRSLQTTLDRKASIRKSRSFRKSTDSLGAKQFMGEAISHEDDKPAPVPPPVKLSGRSPGMHSPKKDSAPPKSPVPRRTFEMKVPSLVRAKTVDEKMDAVVDLKNIDFDELLEDSSDEEESCSGLEAFLNEQRAKDGIAISDSSDGTSSGDDMSEDLDPDAWGKDSI